MNAIEKLTQEATKATAQQKMVAQYLTMRCKESKALCEDILNPKKTLAKCWEYIFEQARKAATNGSFCESGDDPKTSKVFEWAEDYYHAQNLEIDNPKPKAEPQRFDKDKAIAKAQASVAKTTQKKSAPQKKATVVQMPKKPTAQPKPTPKPSTPKVDTKKSEEQFNLFDFM